MSAGRLDLAEVRDDAAWDAFAAASPQGTVFSSSAFLRALGTPVRRLAVHAGGPPLAQVALVEDGGGRAVRFPFTPYLGVLLGPACDPRSRQGALEAFRIGEFLAQALAQRYQRLAMPLSWNYPDLRPFLWHNHGQPDAPHYVATPRYTALLDLQALDPQSFPAQVRACRRQELRKAAGHAIDDTPDLDTFAALYVRTFERQGLGVDADRIALLRRIAAAALADGFGWLSACRTPQGPAAMTLFLQDRERAYYLFAANDPDQRNTGASTRLMFHNIEEARRRGLRELDFVGVNSPARGDFKLSFGPRLALYFELDYGTPAP